MTGLAAARPRTVETSRLCLRPPRPGDASALAAMAADWEVAKQTAGLAHPYGLADAEDWIDAAEGAFGEGGARWVIERTSDGSVIGTIGFGEPEPHDMGFWLGQEHWGRGYATEAVTAAAEHALGAAGVDKLVAGVFAENPASARVLEKGGFVEGEPYERDLSHRGGRRQVRRFERTAQ